MDWINVNEKLPELNEEYLVVWDLKDGEHPVVTSMDYDVKRKCWVDPRGTNEPSENEVLFWMELPEPPKIDKTMYKIPTVHIDQIRTLDDMIGITVYGQCVHGENLARCEICNPNGA